MFVFLFLDCSKKRHTFNKKLSEAHSKLNDLLNQFTAIKDRDDVSEFEVAKGNHSHIETSEKIVLLYQIVPIVSLFS